MKFEQTLQSLARSLVLAVLFQSTRVAFGGAPPKPTKQANFSVEVLVTGAIYSLPDHTGDDAWPPTYDLCRNANLTIGGGTGLTLSKVRMYLPFVLPGHE